MDYTTGKPIPGKVVKENTVNFIVMTRKEAERRERARRDGYRKRYPDGDGVNRILLGAPRYEGDPLDKPDAGGLPY